MTEAIRFDVIVGEPMPLPDTEDDFSANRLANRLISDGELVDAYDSGALTPDYTFPHIARAREAVVAFAEFIETASPDFVEYWQEENDLPLDLSKKRTWDALFG